MGQESRGSSPTGHRQPRGPAGGERVEIEALEDSIVIRRAQPHLTLEELFAGKSAAEWRALYEGAYDWGDDVGREIVEA